MNSTKPKVIIDYYKLRKDLQEQLKLQYPYGFADNLIQFTNGKGQNVSALRFETEDKVYLLRMSAQAAFQIMEDDRDYDENHMLKKTVQKEYEEKHGDTDFTGDNEDFATW